MRHCFLLVPAAVAAMAAALFSTPAMAQNKADRDGHVLTSLWKQYEDARKADRPQKEAEVLSQIKREATRQRLSVDFYDAGKAYISSVTRRDWKQGDPARRQFAEEVKAYNEPIVTYLWMSQYGGAPTGERMDFVLRNRGRFNERNRAFYGRLGLLDGCLPDFIRSDWEFVLWDMLPERYFSATRPETDEIYRELAAEVSGRYPNEGLLAFYIARRLADADRPAAMEALVQKYEGTAVALLARENLLNQEFHERNREPEKAGEAYWKSLHARCLAFEKDRAAMRGDEKKISDTCTDVTEIIGRLTAKSVAIRMDGKEISVVLRNLASAQVTLRDADGDTKLREWTAKDPQQRFFLPDTVRIPIGALPDGVYAAEAVAGKLTTDTRYEQYTLSMAVREDALGTVYVTDYETGEPLREAEIVLRKGNNAPVIRRIAIDGFTPLPQDMITLLRSGGSANYSLFARTGEGDAMRRSPEVNFWGGIHVWREEKSDAGTYCNVYRDRGAYNPGDTVSFKLIAYRGNLVDEVAALAGEVLDVTLIDSEGNEVARQKLTTNGFGSASGSFALPAGLRNGVFALQVRSGSRQLAYSSFHVDEFVLPTFTLQFEKDDTFYRVGDTVAVRGRLTAYSGHSLAGATVVARVRRFREVVFESTVEPENDGRFAVRFPADSPGSYSVGITVTDATGETREFSTYTYVTDRISVVASVQNAADGSYSLPEAEESEYRPYRRGNILLAEDVLKIALSVHDMDGKTIPVPVSYSLSAADGREIRSGRAEQAETLEMDLAGVPSGLYRFHAEATLASEKDQTIHDEARFFILLLRPGDTRLDADVRDVRMSGPTAVPAGGMIRMRAATADGPQWMVATLFGKGGAILESRKIRLDGQAGRDGSLADIALPYKAAYPDAVRLHLFYFKHGEAYTFEREYSRIRENLDIPLEITRFTDKTLPGTKYSFRLQTSPAAEVLVAAWDKSLDAIQRLSWETVRLSRFSLPYVSTRARAGYVSGGYYSEFGDEDLLRREMRMASTKGGLLGAALQEDMRLDKAPMMVEEEAVAFNSTADAVEVAEEAADEAADIDVQAAGVSLRSDFRTALTFQPHLRPAADGSLDVSFTTSDKLSTYYISVFAHDPQMHNGTLRRELTVSVPVKVAVVEPQFLRAGDSYELAASVSSNTEEDVDGTLCLYTYPSADYEHAEPLSVQRTTLRVPAGGTQAARFSVRVPAAGTLGFKVVFVADGFSDGVFLPVPVLPDAQTITEAHSAVLRAGMDREALLRELRSRFVNVPAAEAALTEVSILDMVKAAVPGKVLPSGSDVLSLSEAYYVALLASRLGTGTGDADTDGLLERILACRGADGGFAWFEGMNSSAVITAVVLERFAKLRDRGFTVPDLESSVLFLDRNQFTEELPTWSGWISDAQYMYVRALYPEVAFRFAPQTQTGKRRWAEFRKASKAYLTPSRKDGRGLEGQILAKARRLRTLQQLSASAEGLALAKAWGAGMGAMRRLSKSLKADTVSLLEYAVEHRDGGWYYPNAVLPWRGLLESEAYAHAMLCDLLSSLDEGTEVADGIRLWLMLQKETQHWDADPAFVDALTSILDGSDELLATRVLALSATYTKPYAQILEAGNGMRIHRSFWREVTVEQRWGDRTVERNPQVSEMQPIAPGTPVRVGDKIVVRYEIWSQENRSFVRLDAFREAALRPADQLSGLFRFRPFGYRNVKADRTEYYLDVCPEEDSVITETFFVTQAGTFTAPAVTIESLYASHYRANDGFSGALVAQPLAD